MPKRNLAWMLIVVVIALLLSQMPNLIAERDSVIRTFGVLNEIRTQVLRDYVSEVNDRELVDAGVRAAADAMMQRLGDPHARYFDPIESKRYERWSEGLTGGIGIDVGIVNSQMIVQTVAPSTPAAGAGLAHGDRILGIDGNAVDRIGLLDSVQLLTGEPGQEVRLRVQSGVEPARDVTLVRVPSQTNPVRGWRRDDEGHWQHFVDQDAGIAYIRLTEFPRNAPNELDTVIHHTIELGAKAWILDLRENRGGLLDAAIEVADRFLKSGVIVSTRGRSSDQREWNAGPDGTYPDLPLVVLVNAWTASSAEIVAGALRDQKRAAIVGERTYGKGSVQELISLSNGGTIKLTTRHYYLPSGACIQKGTEAENGGGGWGVEPTHVVPLSVEDRAEWLRKWTTCDWGPLGSSRAGRAATASVPTATRQAAEAAQASNESLHAMFAVDPQVRYAVEFLGGRPNPASMPVSPGGAAGSAEPAGAGKGATDREGT